MVPREVLRVGLRVGGLGFRVEGFRVYPKVPREVLRVGLRVGGLGFGAWSFGGLGSCWFQGCRFGLEVELL